MTNDERSHIELLNTVANDVMNLDKSPTFKLMMAIRRELDLLGMHHRYRDNFIATMDLHITRVSAEAYERIEWAAVKIVRTFYQKMSDAGFGDSSISLMGPKIQIRVGV